jgi:drug/metabolite transporter (DMT)-like permease
MSRAPSLAVICALLSALSWGFGISAVKHALSFMPPAPLLLLQLLFSAGVIGLLAVLSRAPLPSRRRMLLAGATGILEFGIAYGVGTVGLYLTSASNAALISASEPFFILLLAWLILREAVHRVVALCGLAAALGLGLVLMPDMRHAELGFLGGDLLLLAMAFCGGLYAIASRHIVASIDPLMLCALQFAAGSVFVVALVVTGHLLGLFDGRPPLTAAGVGMAFLSGMLQFALPFWLHLVALKRMKASLFSFFLAMVPVFGVIGAAIFLGERPTPLQLAGGALLIGALLIISRHHEEHYAEETVA